MCRLRTNRTIGYTGSTSGYLTFRLTGELKDTIANSYQYQFPVDMKTWKWTGGSAKYYPAFRIPRHKLLDMVLPGDILGHVSAAAAAGDGSARGHPRGSHRERQGGGGTRVGAHRTPGCPLSLGTYITSMVAGDRNLPDTDNFLHQSVLHPVPVPV